MTEAVPKLNGVHGEGTSEDEVGVCIGAKGSRFSERVRRRTCGLRDMGGGQRLAQKTLWVSTNWVRIQSIDVDPYTL